MRSIAVMISDPPPLLEYEQAQALAAFFEVRIRINHGELLAKLAKISMSYATDRTAELLIGLIERRGSTDDLWQLLIDRGLVENRLVRW